MPYTRTGMKKKAMQGYISARGGSISTPEAVAFETGFNAGLKAGKILCPVCIGKKGKH